MSLRKSSTPKVTDFVSEADASEEPPLDIDNNSMQAAHKWENSKINAWARQNGTVLVNRLSNIEGLDVLLTMCC